MRRAMWLAFLLVWGWLAGTGEGFARGRQGLQAPTYLLQGTVVNAVTNEPIRNALVTFSFDRQRFALTGADGTFAFEGLTFSGQGGIDAKKPGYFSPQDARTSQDSVTHRSRQVTVGPDQPPVAFKLIPEGVISGRISGEGGEPIDSLPVHLLFEGVENGRRVVQELPSLETNEEGEFREAELVAGRYFLFVGPGEGAPLPGTTGRRDLQGYPAVFYPDSADLASAAPIEITPGKHAEANVSLSQRQFFHVSGTIGGLPVQERAQLEILNSAGLPVGTG